MLRYAVLFALAHAVLCAEIRDVPRMIGTGVAEGSAGERGMPLEVDGGAVDLGDAMGPLVLQKDGSARRITNWGEMDATERARTLARVSARNRARVRDLRAKGEL